MVAIHGKLYVCGGWNSMKQFDDMYVYDTLNRVWTRMESGSGEKWGKNNKGLS